MFNKIHCLILCLAGLAFSSLLKGGVQLIPGVEDHRLMVKFRAASRPQLDAGGSLILQAVEPGPAMQKILLGPARFTRVIRYTSAEKEIIRRGTWVSPGRDTFNRLDFAGLMYVDLPGADSQQLLQLARELNSLEYVEYTYLKSTEKIPPPGDFFPPTPDLHGNQEWYGPNPGVDCQYANDQGVLGKGVTVLDMEYAWDGFEHEDLVDMDVGFTGPMNYDVDGNHGEAVAGIVVAGHNGFGMKGCAPEAAFRAFPSWEDMAQGVINGLATLDRGAIALIEMQLRGPNGEYGPLDYDPAVWDAIDQAAAAGIIVVLTASNGGSDLDSPLYAEYVDRGDNGVIMVGAGSPDMDHEALSFSTHGTASMHVQGWGRNVFTVGYGAYTTYGGDERQAYTSYFSGTSSAGAIVTGVAAAIQSYALELTGDFLTPNEMRDLLIDTGTPQTGERYVGPLVNARSAMEQLSRDRAFVWNPAEFITDPPAHTRFYAGEAVRLKISAQSSLTAPAPSVILDVQVSGESARYITVLSDPANLGPVPAGGEASAIFIISASHATPMDTEISLTYSLVRGSDTSLHTERFIVSETTPYRISEGDQSTCQGRFYDSGGESNYGDERDYEVTYTPGVTGARLQFEFETFELEKHPDCEFDYLNIYNGPAVTDPLLGTYCGEGSPGTVTSTHASGALTFEFHSDDRGSDDGWAARISCPGVVNVPAGAGTALPEMNVYQNGRRVFLKLSGVSPAPVSIIFTDVRGSTLYRHTIHPTEGVVANSFTLPRHISGLLILQVVSRDFQRVEKLMSGFK